MRMLKFTLSGETAFFKKPEVNSYFYFTYGMVHKAALLGLLGAVLGYGGYSQMKKEKGKKNPELKPSVPEYYERLHQLQLSIVPNNKRGFIPKKIQYYNNSVGYASKEQGGNLIVKEQWLEHPSWDIFLLLNHPEAECAAEALLRHTCVYYPYLGANAHPAALSGARVFDAEEAAFTRGRLGCLFPEKRAALADLDEEEAEEEGAYVTYKYQELLPVGLDEWTNTYVLDKFIYTDAYVEQVKGPVYKAEERNLIFY